MASSNGAQPQLTLNGSLAVGAQVVADSDAPVLPAHACKSTVKVNDTLVCAIACSLRALLVSPFGLCARVSATTSRLDARSPSSVKHEADCKLMVRFSLAAVGAAFTINKALIIAGLRNPPPSSRDAQANLADR